MTLPIILPLWSVPYQYHYSESIPYPQQQTSVTWGKNVRQDNTEWNMKRSFIKDVKTTDDTMARSEIDDDKDR